MSQQSIIKGIITVTTTLLVLMFSYSNTFCQVTKEWETESVFLAPESVVYDSLNNCLYVSNFNDKGGFRKKDDNLYNECISKLSMNGDIEELRWIDGLLGPTGLAIYNNNLFIVERNALCIASINKAKIEKRIFIDEAGLPNDIAIDKNGIAYISDSNNNCIYRIKNGSCEIWYSDSLLNTTNGLYLDNDILYAGNRGNANLISISLTDKTTKIIAKNISDNIDGIKKIKDSFLLSWRTELYSFEPDNTQNVLYQPDVEKDFLADFEYIPQVHLIIIPTLLTNKIIALKYIP